MSKFCAGRSPSVDANTKTAAMEAASGEAVNMVVTGSNVAQSSP